MEGRGIWGAPQHEPNGAGVKDDKQWLVTLKDGTTGDGMVVAAAIEKLRGTLVQNPGVVGQLYAHAIEPSVSLPEAVQRDYYTNSEMGRLLFAVLRSGAKKIGDGIVLGDPFEDDEQTQLVVRTIAENQPILNERFERKLRAELGDYDSGRRR